MARCKTVQDFEEEARNERLFGRIPNPVHGTHARKLDMIDAVVDNSCEGSLSNAAGQKMVKDLWGQKDRMTPSEYHEACTILGVHLQNNLAGGCANDVYHNFVCDERTA